MATRTANGLPPALDDACRSLYVGNLDPRVTEVMLREIFASLGEVTHAKIIPDKNNQHGGLNYGFIDMVDHTTASAAIETLNGRKVLGYEIKVNWAYQGNNATREDTTNHHHVFVGDLSPDVTDQVLNKAFSAFGSLSDARVMWDMNTGKSRGYGFLAFREREDAERAISTMNGEWLGSRAIRVNWANQKNQNQPDQVRAGASPADDYGSGFNAVPQQPTLSYDVVVNQSPYTNVTVYVGNLAPSVREADLFPLFQLYGYVHEVRLQHDRGFSFIKMDTHEHATMSICYLNGHVLHGRALKVSWGKDKNAGDQGSSGYASGTGGYGDPMASAGGPYGGYGAPATSTQQPAGILVDPATLPPLTDPIAAAAAAAAQAAVIYQLQVQSQVAAAGQSAVASAGNPAAYANDYYAYYAAYYSQAPPTTHNGQAPPS